MKNKIAVIGANAPLYSYYEQAYNLGYQIYGFAWEEGAVCKKFCKEFYPIDFKEKDKILSKCKEIGIDGITSFSLESALPTVIYVASHMGLVQNTEECLNHIKNKYTMRESMKKDNILQPEYYHLRCLSDIDWSNLAYPVIVKPVDNGGKKGVSLVETKEAMEAAFKYAVDNSRDGSALIESFISGREFSVEYLSCNGKHYFMQLTDKVNTGAPHFVECEHHQPANVTAQQLQSIKNLTEQTLTSLHITNSASHTELKMNENGDIYIIEVGARLGGDSITSELVRLSTGVDIVHESLKLATGEFKPVEVKNVAHASKYYYIPGKDWVKKLINSDREYIVQSDKTFSEKPPISNGDRSAWAICVNKDERITKSNYELLK